MGNTVKDIADIDHKMPEIKEEGIPFISPIDFTKDGKIDFQNAKKISKSDFERLSQKIKPSVNDIIFPRYGTIGVLRLVNSDLDFLVSYSCATIVTDKVYSNPKYIYYALQTSLAQSEINKYKVTTTQSNIGIKSLKQFFIPLAPLAEQQCIVSSIESIFAQIDMLEQNKSNLETAIKQAKSKILDLAIHGKLVPQDPNDEPASVLIEKLANADKSCEFANGKLGKCSEGTRHNRPYKKFEDEVPFEIPENWGWCKLGDIGKYKKGPFGSSLTKAMFVPKSSNTVKVYEQKNAIQKNHNLGEYYITREYFESKMKSFEVFPNDVIVSCAGTIGETYILPENIEQGIINQALMKMKISKFIDINYFLKYFDHILKEESVKNGKGTAIKNIPPFDVFKNYPVPLPPLAEQQRIVTKIEELFAQLDSISEQLA